MVAVDISYAQGYPNYDNLATNIDMVIARAGTLEGGGMLQDSKLTYNRQHARRLGKRFGTYLFNGPVDPVKAADWYLSIIDYRPGDLMAIDVESPNAWNPTQVLAFLGRVKAKTGVVPATYGSTSLLFQSQWKIVSDFGSPLWAANYGSNNGRPGRDPGNGPWATRILWQYTSTAQHSGFGGSVDTNLVDDTALNAYLGNTTTPEGEEDMPLNDDDKKWLTTTIRDTVNALFKPLADGQTSEAINNIRIGAVARGFQEEFSSDWLKDDAGQPQRTSIRGLVDATREIVGTIKNKLGA